MGYSRQATWDTLRRRAEVLSQIRAFFAARDVLEVETPALSMAAASDPAIDSIAATVTCLEPAEHYLHTSPEYAMKRLLASGCGDCYQICRVFRDGEIGRWHQPEFTLLEWYRVGWSEDQLMEEVAALINTIFEQHRTRRPCTHLSYADAFRTYLGCDAHGPEEAIRAALLARGLDVPSQLHGDALLDLALAAAIVPRLEPNALTFINDYPASQAALAAIKSVSPAVAARFEVFCEGLELGNGYRELTDAAEQRQRFEQDLQRRSAAGRATLPLDYDFLQALPGLPPCSGIALGIDRLVAVAAGLPSVAAGMAFSHTVNP